MLYKELLAGSWQEEALSVLRHPQKATQMKRSSLWKLTLGSGGHLKSKVSEDVILRPLPPEMKW